VYGEYFTDFVQNGAEVLFIITNDGWWRDTPGHRQHFDFARLRAVETRRAIARSANTGRSGFITSRGDVRETLEWEERGTITADVALNRRTTLYVRFGDWICRISLLVLGLSVLYFIAYRIRKKDHIV
jgi:apolipoprotein N-acyltransferase